MVAEDKLSELDDEVSIYDASRCMLPECSDIEDYWAKVSYMEDDTGNPRFPYLSLLAKAMLVLPHGNADVERLFSHVTQIKTEKRNLLANDTLNNILHSKYNQSEVCYNFKPASTIVASVRPATKAHVAPKAQTAVTVIDSEPEETETVESQPSTSCVLTTPKPVKRSGDLTNYFVRSRRPPKAIRESFTGDFVVEDD